jgi:ketosteroid isomerase-like protein
MLVATREQGGRSVGGAALTLERLLRAMNEHDLEGVLANVDADYRSEQPAHPERAFGGREQVRENWGAIFRDVPDFRARLIGSAADGETAWGEWGWRGSRSDGCSLEMRGVTIFGVRGERMTWGRLSMEPVEMGGDDIRGAVKRMTAGAAGEEPSTAERNKGVARRFGEDVWGRGDMQAADEVLAEDFVEHNAVPAQPPGREGHKLVLQAGRAAFPDLTITV